MHGKKVVLADLVVRPLDMEHDAGEITSMVNNNFGAKYSPDQFKEEKMCHLCGLVVDHEGFAVGGLLYECPTPHCITIPICTITPFCQGQGVEELLIDEVISKAEKNNFTFIVMYVRPEEKELVKVLQDRMFEKQAESYEQMTGVQYKQVVFRYSCVPHNRLTAFYKGRFCTFEVPELN